MKHCLKFQKLLTFKAAWRQEKIEWKRQMKSSEEVSNHDVK